MNIKVISKNSSISCWNWEWIFFRCSCCSIWKKKFNVNKLIYCNIINNYIKKIITVSAFDWDNSIFLFPKAQYFKQSFNILFSIYGPNSNMITCLIMNTRPSNVQLYMNTITNGRIEKITGSNNRRWIRILGVIS